MVVGLFVTNGLAIGVWGGSLPAFRARLDAGETGIGILLAVTGIAAVISMQLSGRLSDRFGAVRPSLVGAAVMVVGLSLAAWAPTFGILILAGVLMGLGNGAMDVGMNALGVAVEMASPAPLMSRFHATFSVGSFLGAGIVMLSAIAGVTVESSWIPIAMALVVFVVGMGVVRIYAPKDAMGAQARGEKLDEKRSIPPVAWALGVMALCFGLTEGTGIDWAAIHVTDVMGVSTAEGAVGLVAISLAMLSIRFVGDHIVARFGRSRVVQMGAVVALAGYAGTVFAETMVLVVLSWLLVGSGVGMLAPQIYALAGYIGGGRVLAMVTAFGYTSFLIGPAMIGFVAAHVGIQLAMVVPMVSAVVLITMALVGVLRSAEHAGGLSTQVERVLDDDGR